MRPGEHLHWLSVESAAFSRVLQTGDLTAPVAGCPGWSLAELAAHLGGVHRWARRAVLDGPSAKQYAAPADREPLCRWFDEGATALGVALRGTAADAPCWTLAPPATAAFWMRRQAHETTLHRWDAQASQGRPEPIDPALAADGVAEVIDVFYPRQIRLGRQAPLTHSLRVEVAGQLARTITGDGSRSDIPSADATITGPAEALLLLLWKRATLDDSRVQLIGSQTAALNVLTANLTP